MTELQPEVKYADINNSRIEYLDYDGDGPVIIMLHATGFLPWLWHPIAKAIARSSKIIAPYFCDHRQEEPEAGGVSWLHLAEDLCELCNALEIEKPAGRSFNGRNCYHPGQRHLRFISRKNHHD